MYIPYELAHLVIGQDLTPREAWAVLVPAIQASQLETVCRPLIYFLEVACMLPDASQRTPVQHASVGVENHIITPSVTQHRRQHLLYNQLPALKPQPTRAASDPALQRVADSVEYLMQDTRFE